MSKLVTKIGRNGILPQICYWCGIEITAPPYEVAKVVGRRAYPKYYHASCYPRDSRPR